MAFQTDNIDTALLNPKRLGGGVRSAHSRVFALIKERLEVSLGNSMTFLNFLW